ncbi:hypothetical protein, partial [Achromobacter sp. UBA5777]|uniref:hypothetical protein n=1 Tax=Achromobacter sp. UBA5777 TaxID=1945913 RepID=UPI0025C630D2
VKVGHRQALILKAPPVPGGALSLVRHWPASRANVECAQITTRVGGVALCGKIVRVNSLERYRE